MSLLGLIQQNVYFNVVGEWGEEGSEEKAQRACKPYHTYYNALDLLYDIVLHYAMKLRHTMISYADYYVLYFIVVGEWGEEGSEEEAERARTVSRTSVSTSR